MATKTLVKKNPMEALAGERQYSKLADALGVTRSHVCRIMKGNREPSLGLAVKLSKALGVTLDKLAEMLAHSKPKKCKPVKVVVTRSSIDGKFVPESEARRSPATTQRETVQK